MFLQLSPAEVGGHVGRVAVEVLSGGAGLVGPGEWYSPFSLGCTNGTLYMCICQVGKHCVCPGLFRKECHYWGDNMVSQST